MHAEERAKQIARLIEAAIAEPGAIPMAVSRRGGCAACDPGACTVCGFLFTGEVFQIEHPVLGKRVVSDRALHYLGHGMHHYQTGWVIRGEPVAVDLDLEELARYLNI